MSFPWPLTENVLILAAKDDKSKEALQADRQFLKKRSRRLRKAESQIFNSYWWTSTIRTAARKTPNLGLRPGHVQSSTL